MLRVSMWKLRNAKSSLESNWGHCNLFWILEFILKWRLATNQGCWEWQFWNCLCMPSLGMMACEFSCRNMVDIWILPRLKYPALRVPPAETRLTVYRRLSVFWRTDLLRKFDDVFQFYLIKITAEVQKEKDYKDF